MDYYVFCRGNSEHNAQLLTFNCLIFLIFNFFFRQKTAKVQFCENAEGPGDELAVLRLLQHKELQRVWSLAA